MNGKLILLLIVTIAKPTDGFFQSIFHLGARVSNCMPWSLWSSCWSTKDYGFLFKLPGFCYYNQYGQQFAANGGVSVVEQAYKYLKLVNASSGPCGQCIYQVSCSRQCNQAILPGQYGFSSQLCEDKNMDQSEACKLNLLATDGVCQMWPPVKDVILEPLGAKMIKDQIYAMQTTSCVTIESECYCCCLPYVPEPTTKRCRIGLVT